MISQHKELPLNIYRASAGSGKTHLLTGFFIKLLFVNDLLPETHSGEMKFSEILAVTFTNKATAEMKTRIIEELYQLSVEPEKSDYWEDVVPAGTEKSDVAARERISKKATHLLVQILNEYSSFNISTIDSFFQRIVRSFARELNIPGNYEVELDADHVLDAAVSNFLDKLDERNSQEIYDWMVKFSRKRISEGAGWDIRATLLAMAKKVLNSEVYRQNSEAIQQFTSDREALHRYADMLAQIQKDWRDTLRQLGKEGQQLMKNADVEPTDFKYKGAGSASCFAKWAEGDETPPGPRFLKGAEDPDTLYGKKGPSESFRAGMKDLMLRCIDHTSGITYRNYLSASAINSHFYELGIIAQLDHEVTEYCNEQNFMLLSSTTEMLSRLIGKDDAPFIYEKTGTHIHAYMIDEFQDTSGMQWGNFKPLVSNALAEQYQNLIVGDVKQSIYRWRGGDWNLLNSEINSYEPELHYDDTSALCTNWRSLPAVINFNNEFFTRLAKQLDLMLSETNTRIQQIYADVEQKIPEKKIAPDKPVGLVHIGFLKPKDEEGNVIEKPKKDDFMNEAARRLPEVIIQLQQNGFEPRDIAILCRRNSECRWAAETMLRYKQQHPECPYGMDIISSEALQLSARPVVHVLISMMRHLLSPESPILCAIARTSLMQLEGLSAEEALHRFFAIPAAEREFHPELVHRPLYEMTEQLIALLPASSHRNDAPYLQAFRDVVLEYASMQSSDLSGFLQWWDQTGYKRSIATPEGQNAIQIMSVHKSKGLGMPAIVMPFASWDLDIDTSHDELLWCKPQTAPFTLDALLPIKLDKSLSDTIFAADYLAERERAVIDNINTAYVAFTRAKEAMVILAPNPSKDGTKLEHWLQDYCTFHEKEGDLTLGDWARSKKDTNRPSTVEAVSPSATQDGQEGVTPPLGEVERGSLPQISILHDPRKPDVTAKQRGTYIHLVLQDVRVASEAPSVISRHYMRGDIEPSVIAEEEMQQVVSRLLAIPEVQPWFRPGLQVVNELTLMDNNGHQRRPDRVVIDEKGHVTVIDYKTGGSNKGYSQQVQNYMSLLRQMGFHDIDGYLLFLRDEKVVKVNATH